MITQIVVLVILLLHHYNGDMAHEESLHNLLGDMSLKTILAIGLSDDSVGRQLIDDYLTQHNTCTAEHIGAKDILERLDGLGRYDLVIVSQTIELMSRLDATHLISKLRDIHSQRLVLFVPIGDGWPNFVSQWQKRDLLSFGLIQLNDYEGVAGPIHIYGYDILTYKTCPDWLNSRFWATPNLFGKHWW